MPKADDTAREVVILSVLINGYSVSVSSAVLSSVWKSLRKTGAIGWEEVLPKTHKVPAAQGPLVNEIKLRMTVIQLATARTEDIKCPLHMHKLASGKRAYFYLSVKISQ